ncbi:phage tail fiber protein [Xenorhabdus sp. BG5]|uniref:phage tail fiber protein n=1 Tax=Xenorhabdus sp. BG5 TaxID=2782014 RepID=UPI0040402FB0
MVTEITHAATRSYREYRYNAGGAWGVHGGISSPKNNSGLELIYIDDQVQKDGCITIKIFHRQHTHLPKQFQNRRIKDICGLF